VLMGTGSWFGTSKSGLVGTFVDGVNIRNGLTMIRSRDFSHKLSIFFHYRTRLANLMWRDRKTVEY
jgi:hypothetical protein